MKRIFVGLLILVTSLLCCRTVFADSQGVAPLVLSVSPMQSELNVARSSNISVTFDTEMDPASINGSSFVANALLSGNHSGAITYNHLTNTATLNPSQDFAVGEIVTVSLTTDIRSSQGTSLGSGFTWSFTITVNGGDGTFIPDSNYSVGDYTHSLCAADFDTDGDMDLAAANHLDNNVSILL
ncbi:MAG: Ig-like domain-containing protein, partial [candidate division Zixibacteria bacterium]|nr:Ig-like domain-containing protein [candidate division Zixibacteria bacterium]